MDKEILVFEMFKDKVAKEYIKILHVGVIPNSDTKSVYYELEDYCNKVGADLSKVKALFNDYKRELYQQEKSKKPTHLIDYNQDTKRPTNVDYKIRQNAGRKLAYEVNNFINRNGELVK